MATNFPGSLDEFTNPSAGQVVGSALIGDMADAIEAVEAVSLTPPFLAWSFDPVAATILAPMPATGVLGLVRLTLPACTVTNLNVVVTASGTVTASYMALYTGAGALLSQSASGGAFSAAAGMKTFPLGAAQAVTAGTYYAAIWATFTGSPSIAGGSNLGGLIVNPGLSAPDFRFATADTGLVATAPSTLGAQTSSTRSYWVGVS